MCLSGTRGRLEPKLERFELEREASESRETREDTGSALTLCKT
jgi:hypothetical protein